MTGTCLQITFGQQRVTVYATCLGTQRVTWMVFVECTGLQIVYGTFLTHCSLTMWHTFVEAELRSILSIPDAVVLAATIPLGRPEGHHGPVRRRPLPEVVFDDGWAQPAPWAQDPPGTRFTSAGPPP